MEKRLNAKLDQYMTNFKEDIKTRATALGLSADDRFNQLLQYIYDYERLSFQPDDTVRRKRIKNYVPIYDRCCAKRYNGEQCTRRKKDGCEYCGTHTKGAPYGKMESDTQEGSQHTTKVEVWAQDIRGIMYYVDKHGNVYDTTDIIKNQINPKIVAKYVVEGEQYIIPEFEMLMNGRNG